VEWVVVAAVLGLLCIFAEIFLPGGVLGGLGVLLLAASLYLAYKEWGFGAPFMLLMLGFVAGGVILGVMAFKIMPRTGIGKRIFLADTQKGYDVSVANDREMIGKEGVAVSFLRPAGIAEVDGKRVNVVTEGGFIEKDARIKVCELKDNHLVVRRVESQSQRPAEDI